VVLLARDTPAAAPGIKDLSIDMSQWQPLIEDRAFVAWLVKVGGAVGGQVGRWRFLLVCGVRGWAVGRLQVPCAWLVEAGGQVAGVLVCGVCGWAAG
jgi:hypothetical protein